MKMSRHCALIIAIFLLSCDMGFATSTKEEIENDFDVWLASDAGVAAVANGYYDPEDRAFGIQRFQQAKERVETLEKENPTAEFSVQTPFALMSTDEFMAYIARSGLYAGRISNITADLGDNEDAIDWVTDDGRSQCISRVKDQGQCGSCWAFSVAGTLESTYCALKHKLYNLAEQQLVSCDRVEGSNEGCNGGWITTAYDWIATKNDGGLCLSSDYPYTASDSTCETSCSVKQLGVKGRVELQSESEVLAKLKSHPIAVGVYVDSKWQYYDGGVVVPTQSSEVNHAVIVVGYGHLKKQVYWKIRNSWGASWGDKGYIKLQVGHAISIPAYPTF